MSDEVVRRDENTEQTRRYDNPQDKHIVLLQRRINEIQTKIEELQNEWHGHKQEYQEHVKEEEDRWRHLMSLQEKNNELQEENSKNIEKIADSTKDLVEAWEAANGAVKVGAVFGRFVKWASGFAFIGIGISWIADKLQWFK